MEVYGSLTFLKPADTSCLEQERGGVDMSTDIHVIGSNMAVSILGKKGDWIDFIWLKAETVSMDDVTRSSSQIQSVVSSLILCHVTA